MNQQAEDPDQERRPTIAQVAASTLAAAFGVQSSKNRQRDFKYGKASTFIVAGIVFTVALILLLYLAVRLSLRAAGAG